MPRPRRELSTFAAAQKSFMGFLEGTHKSRHTWESYRSDLRTFRGFLKDQRADFAKITLRDLQTYSDWLHAQGQASNTIRRKLMTVRKFLGYLERRKKRTVEISSRVATPLKVERIPLTFDYAKLLKAIQKMKTPTEIHARNQLLLWVLLDTGALVSEVVKLRFTDFRLPRASEDDPTVEFLGKSERRIPVSAELFQAVQAVGRGTKEPRIFVGHNKYGPLGGMMTPRGAELMVAEFASRNRFEGLTPRGFRHSAIRKWFSEGRAPDEIQQRLGLKSQYAFRAYRPWMKEDVSGKNA